jgi:hypothetical protein
MYYRIALLSLVSLAVLAGKVQAQFPIPQPEKEHGLLKQFVGTWDATIETGDEKSKGVMVYSMELGGLWLMSKFEGAFGEQKFEGRGLDGYDPAKKKIVGTWVDSMSTSLSTSEGSFDESGKVLTAIGTGPGQDGQPSKYKSVSTIVDQDTMVFTMSAVGADGSDEFPMMKITYKRRK